MGRAVAVVVVAVVVTAFGSEEQGGQHEQTTGGHQHGGEGEPGGFHGARGLGLLVDTLATEWPLGGGATPRFAIHPNPFSQRFMGFGRLG